MMKMHTNEVYITDEYITLAQLLKKEDIVSSGGQVKMFLSETSIFLNGNPVNQRGKKLYPEDVIEIDNTGVYVIRQLNSNKGE